MLPSPSSLLSPTDTPSGNFSPFSQTSNSLCVPVIASGTTLDTSCAKKPSTKVLSPFIQLNLAGFNCFNLVVASKV